MNIEMPDMISEKTSAEMLYDAAIIGGGLAGLSLSIQLAKMGYKVALFEKETYPFHKVCGEYISLESWDFLESLGVPLSEMNLPVIHKLLVSAPNGNYLEHMLPLGGFGVSRFTLDALLAEIASSNGVHVFENSRVNQVSITENECSIESSWGNFRSKLVAGTFGKKSNLDISWKRNFTLQKPHKLNNYIAVKYHISIDHPEDLIALHNFKNGYCGISKIEDEKYCLCYLTTAKNLNQSNNNISELEKNILSQNPFLKKIFEEATFLYEKPEVISQVSFSKKKQVENHVLMVGDAAGMITPLCGNGMSMALHASKIASAVIDDFLQNKIDRNQMELIYRTNWQQVFNKRLSTGRFIQRFFGHQALSDLLINFLKNTPLLLNKLVNATHGKPF